MDIFDIIVGTLRFAVFMAALVAYMLLFPIHIITLGMLLGKPMSFLRRRMLHVLDPVCQDALVTMYCLYDCAREQWGSYSRNSGATNWSYNEYKWITSVARLVRLVPCRDLKDTSRISSWEPDPKEIQRLGLAMPSKKFAKPKEPSKSVFLAILCWCGRKLFCENPEEIRYGWYDSMILRLRPVMDPDNPLRIVEWVPDPEEVELANSVRARMQSGMNDNKSSVQTSKNGACKPNAKVVSSDSFIAIDGSNIICCGDEKCNGVRGTRVLSALVNSLVRNGYQCKVFLDGSMIGRLKHKEHDESGLDYLKDGEKKGWVVIAPGRVEADGQILQFAEFEKNVHIITNDHYRDYEEMHSWLKDGNAANRLHGINVVPMGNGRFRILVAGFNLDITVQA